jgi:hypothetical protein
LIVWVLPGFSDVLAYDFLFIKALISDDLPTLDLPENAYSGMEFSGSLELTPTTVSKLTLLITIKTSL